jgi:hypothetical protein
VIYQVKSLVTPSPPTLTGRLAGSQIELAWDRGSLQEAGDVTGPWNDVPDAFSPFVIEPAGPRKFYRAHY